MATMNVHQSTVRVVFMTVADLIFDDAIEQSKPISCYCPHHFRALPIFEFMSNVNSKLIELNEQPFSHHNRTASLELFDRIFSLFVCVINNGIITASTSPKMTAQHNKLRILLLLIKDHEISMLRTFNNRHADAR